MTICANAQKVNFTKKELVIEKGDKLAILMVHFGTTNDVARAKTYDTINTEVQKEFKNATVTQAYSSRIIIKILKERGIDFNTPLEMLEELQLDGYTHVVVQPTHIIDGVEMESLRRDVESVANKFKEVRLGRPLLYTPEDYTLTIDALKDEVKTTSDATLLVGHGTYEAITSSYAMVDYMLKLDGDTSWSVATIEGYPTFDQGVSMLERANAKSVTLVPFMFVAGEHAKNDIKGEWKEELEKKGYKVDVVMKGMGENQEVRKIFIDHIKFAMDNIHLDIMKKKEQYAK